MKNIKIFSNIFILVVLSLAYKSNAQTITATRLEGGTTNYSCDGIGDQVQINQAMEYVKASGGIVNLSEGTFVIDGNIYFSGDNTTLEGAGMNQTIIKLVDSAGWDYYAKNSSDEWELIRGGAMIENKAEAMNHLTIKDLKIDGNKYNQWLYDPQTGDTIRDKRNGSHVFDGQGHYGTANFVARDGSYAPLTNLLFSNVYIYESTDDGFAVYNCKDVVVENCKGVRGGHSFVYINNPIGLTIKNCDIMVTANSGIRWYDGNHILVRNNHIYGEPSKTGNSNFCIEVTSGWTGTVCDDMIFENNRFKFTAGAAIALDAKTQKEAKNTIIRNNIILQCGNTGTSENQRETGGINIKNFTNTLIENNTIVNCIGGGIRIGDSTGFNTEWDYETGITAIIKNNIITNSIKGNELVGSYGYGIDIIGSSNSAICTFNNVWNNESGGYRGCEPGIGSMSVNPIFNSVAIGTNFWDTNDESADLHLKSESGRWNSISKSWETDLETSLSINAGNPSSIYSNELSPNGNRINMGAYGNTVEASQGTKSPPISDAGADQFKRDTDGNSIEYITLDGSGSSDNGTITSYSWSKDGVEIATGIKPTAVEFALGKSVVVLTVTDNEGLVSSDQVEITVQSAGGNLVPIADAGKDVTVMEDESGNKIVVLDGSGSSDSDGNIVDYSWMENDLEIGTGVSPSISFPMGEHTVVLKVTDNEGGAGSDSVKVTVNAKANYSLQFNNDSKDESVLLEGLPNYSTLTIEMWVKQERSSDDTDCLLFMGEEGKRLTLKGSGHNATWGESWQNFASDGINLNEWHHLAFVVDNSSLTAIYIDGVTSSILSSQSIELPGSSFGIASYYGSSVSALNFNGKIDELRYWNVARTESEINEKIRVELTGNETGLVGYWNFNDGVGTTLTNMVAGGVNGTLLNMEANDWVTDTPFNLTTINNSKEKNIIPKHFSLSQNYPNPFNPTTIISFALPKAENVKLFIYNMLGEKIAELVNENMSAGNHSVSFDASKFVSGIYIYRVSAGQNIVTKKMMLLK